MKGNAGYKRVYPDYTRSNLDYEKSNPDSVIVEAETISHPEHMKVAKFLNFFTNGSPYTTGWEAKR